MACCTYTFRQFTFYEAIQKTTQLRAAIPGRLLLAAAQSRASRRETERSDADPLRKPLKARLDDAGVKLVSCYVASLPKPGGGLTENLEFGKQLRHGDLRGREPAPEAFDLLARLADEYRINIAIHNHPKPSSRRYLEPAGRGQRLPGAEPANRLLHRHGPLGSLRLAPGRGLAAAGRPRADLPHLKDIVQFGVVKARIAPVGNRPGRHSRHPRRGNTSPGRRKPVFGIEYERVGKIGPDLRSIAFLEQVAGSLAG